VARLPANSRLELTEIRSWLMRSNDGQFYLRDSDDNTELLNPEDAEKVYGELSNKHVAFEEAFKHHKP
jgi:hypothetical protein